MILIIGIVYGSNLKRAEAKLDEMIKYWMLCDQTINRIVKTSIKYKVSLTNGDVWYAVSVVEDNGRGMLCNVALIDKEIPRNIIDEKIKPFVKARPYTAIGYY